MSYYELVQLYFERSNALQWYWTVYIGVIGGLLAFSALRKEPDLVTTLLITILFSFFAYKNLGAIRDVTLQRYAVHDLILQFDVPTAVAHPGAATLPAEAVREALEPTLVVPDYLSIKKFHIACDWLTVAALWTMEWRRRRWARTHAVT